MPAIFTTERLLENGRAEYDYSIPAADSTEWISTDPVPGCKILVVAEGVLSFEVRNGAGALTRIPPAAMTDFWLNPTATEIGYWKELVPPEFRLTNATAGALLATVYLIPGISPTNPAR